MCVGVARGNQMTGVEHMAQRVCRGWQVARGDQVTVVEHMAKCVWQVARETRWQGRAGAPVRGVVSSPGLLAARIKTVNQTRHTTARGVV